jgi:transposase-like protein
MSTIATTCPHCRAGVVAAQDLRRLARGYLATYTCQRCQRTWVRWLARRPRATARTP